MKASTSRPFTTLLITKPGERAPILVQLNGLDSTKEMKVLVGLPLWLAKRGVSSGGGPSGTGEALRLQGLTARFDAEHWASRVVDWLEQHPEVDAQRIYLRRCVAAGYYRPRAGHGASLRPRRGLGCQPRLARRAETSVGKRRRPPGAALLGPRVLGLKCRRHRRLHAHRPRRAPGRRGREDQGAVPGHARRA